MKIQLPNGNTINISTYDYYFRLQDDDVEGFYQSCMADDLGIYIDNPFSGKKALGVVTEDDEEGSEIPE